MTNRSMGPTVHGLRLGQDDLLKICKVKLLRKVKLVLTENSRDPEKGTHPTKKKKRKLEREKETLDKNVRVEKQWPIAVGL